MWTRAANVARASPARAALAAGTALTAGAVVAQQQRVRLGGVPMTASASGSALEAPNMSWSHTGHLQGFDHAALRRGWQVYKEVCAACHSLNQLHWRQLVGVVMTEEEAKELAAEEEYPDEPNGEGEIEDRPGKLSDPLPRPYPNEQAARAGNNGAYPPDLSLISKAREAGPDYVFGLMTGYRDPPAGIELREGLYYNVYFPGGAIAMTQPLSDEMIEYEDGTESSVSQMAKDVAVFLNWAAEPEMDQRKKFGLKAIMLLTMMSFSTLYWRRQKWSSLKTRVISFTQQRPVHQARR